MGSYARPKFPLPKGFFGDVQLTHDQRQRFRRTAHAQVQAALADELHFVHNRNRQVDLDTWKLVTHKHHLQVYRRRERQTEVDSSMPSMMSVGQIEGKLEDLIYGSYDKSHEEIKITVSYMDVSAKDCTVLSTIETATADDPFHYLGVKWLLSKFPLVRLRDWCYLDAMGITKDKQGRRYGYFLLHSVDLPDYCPPFNAKVAIRGQLYFTFIFRDAEKPGMIDVFSRGSFDPAGDLIHQFSVIATASVLTDIVGSVSCAEAKKLTLLAFSNAQRKLSTPNKSECSVCCRSVGLSILSMKVCSICTATACSRCTVKKHIFAGLNHSICRINCCANCIIRAKEMKVRPAEEEFSLLYSSLDPPLSSSQRSTAHSNPFGAPHRSFELDQNGLDDELIEDESDIEALIARVNKARSKTSEAPPHSKPTEPAPSIPSRRKRAPPPPVPATPPPFTIHTAMAKAAATPAPSRPMGIEAKNQASTEHERMYSKMIELQKAARKARAITQANQELMRNMQ